MRTTPRSAAIWLAQSALRAWLTRGIKQYGLAFKYTDDRGHVYAVDVEGWDILIRDTNAVICVNYRTAC